MIDLGKNLSIWRSAGVALRDGARAEDVLATYRSLGFDPTSDVIEMYAQIGGMREFDDECWRLWSLDEVRVENKQASPLGVYFSDDLLNSWQYLLVSSGSVSAVYTDDFDGNLPHLVASSLEDFFTAYAADAVSVLHPDLRR